MATGKGYVVPLRLKIRQLAPDRLEIVEGGGWMALVGAIFLLPGLAMMLIGFQIVPTGAENFSPNGIPVLGLFGIPFFLVGAWALCKRRWMTMDLTQRTLVTQTGWLRPMFSKVRCLSEFNSVTLLLQINSSNSTNGQSVPITHYPVLLSAVGDGKSIVINDLNDFGQAYALASQLAGFLRIPLEDLTSDHPLEVTPADIAHPLQARLHADAGLSASLTPPATLQSQVQGIADGVQISIPGQMPARLVYYFSLAAVVFGLFIIAFPIRGFLQSVHPPAEVQYFAYGITLLFICSPLFSYGKAVLIARATRTIISVEHQLISIEGYLGKERKHRILIPISDILDIDYSIARDPLRSSAPGWIALLSQMAGSRGISIKAISGIFTFGVGLPDIEVEYLAALVKKTLAASPV